MTDLDPWPQVRRLQVKMDGRGVPLPSAVTASVLLGEAHVSQIVEYGG